MMEFPCYVHTITFPKPLQICYLLLSTLRYLAQNHVDFVMRRTSDPSPVSAGLPLVFFPFSVRHHTVLLWHGQDQHWKRINGCSSKCIC